MPWHFFFESLAYSTAFRIYVSERNKAGDFLETSIRWNIVIAAVAGAAIGSKVLYWFENPQLTAHNWTNIAYLLAGKTMVGGLLGGTIAVELVKLRTGIHRRTGDLFAIPMAIGIAIGRIGCFLAGKQDDTYGIPTSLPWGLDIGDGIRRHPVQLYEVAAMLILAAFLARIRPPKFAEGDRFRLFVLSYYSWRLLIDFLKPGIRFEGLTTLQWTCAAALLWYTPDLWRITVSCASAMREKWGQTTLSQGATHSAPTLHPTGRVDRAVCPHFSPDAITSTGDQPQGATHSAQSLRAVCPHFSPDAITSTGDQPQGATHSAPTLHPTGRVDRAVCPHFSPDTITSTGDQPQGATHSAQSLRAVCPHFSPRAITSTGDKLNA